MEWLAGAVVGGVIGFISAVVSAVGVTEYTARRERGRRRDDIAKLLKDEIAWNKRVVVSVAKDAAAAKETGEPMLHLHVPFRREILGACVNDLGLLPHRTRQPIQRFYIHLASLDFLQDEGYLRQTVYPTSEERPLEQVLEWLRDQLLKGLDDALEAGNEALAELEKLIGQK